MIFVKIAAVLEDCPVPNTVSFFFFLIKETKRDPRNLVK